MNTNEADQAKREEYHRYLNSPEWKVVRSRCLANAKFKCAVCNSKYGVQAHHLTYERIFHEADDDLMALCFNHHKAIEWLISHGKMRRRGDVKLLRRQTVKLLKTTEPKKHKRNPVSNSMQAKLLKEPWFLGALRLQRKTFKKLLRQKLYQFSNFERISANAFALYNRRNQISMPKNEW